MQAVTPKHLIKFYGITPNGLAAPNINFENKQFLTDILLYL